MRRIVGIAGAIALGCGAPLAGQYFGQNKVQYQSFDFHVIQTAHFDVFYYQEEREAALDAARMAERAYARLSRVLNHEFEVRKPLILYASHSHFQQTNALAGSIPEGVQGVTEFFKHRMVLPFTGSYAEFEHVLQHELVHNFQYDVYSRGRPGAGIQTLIQVSPPDWFMEGMAEYLSVGPISPHTAMWLRDAALEGHLPTIRELTYNPRIFPYRYGHAIWSFVGERWGDEVIGEILQASATAGIEGAFRRALGFDLEELSDEWRDAVRTTYLPQVANHDPARRVAQRVLDERRTGGTYNLAPVLTPDGREIAFFSERNSFFVDLWLADAETGRVKRRLVRSALSTNYESLRFINSAGSFSPDGRHFAIAAKRGDRDDLVILDVRRAREVRRIALPIAGATNPSWSPDGQRLVFTGHDGGLSDLYIVDRDGSNLRRLTHDKYADLLPAWSPDGRRIAFTTDRGGDTDFDLLRFGNLRIAIYDLESGAIEPLAGMDVGKNVNPAWAPDGRALAFVSDRTGISNVYLYDFGDGRVYQLTDVYTGVSGITEVSPVVSWARDADRLAFAYYEDGNYGIYAVDNPRSLKREPWEPPADPPVIARLTLGRRPAASHAAEEPVVTTTPAQVAAAAASVYRSADGLRASAALPSGDSARRPVSIASLLDSATLALPDTGQFAFRPYRVRYSPDYVARPTVGYARDNFGRGFFGGTAVSMSDMLGNHTIVLSGAINGRLSEAQALGVYINQAHRFNWAVGFSQEPYYFYGVRTLEPTDLPGTTPDSGYILTDRYRRFVLRDLFGEAYYPFSRFRRLELSVHAVDISDATLELSRILDQNGFALTGTTFRTVSGPNTTFVQPGLALVHDRALFGYVGPFAGSRSRFQYSTALGDWRFHAATGDYREYVFLRPFTIAVRGLFFGRFGRDADRFPVWLGTTELIRGYTYGSLARNECSVDANPATRSGCAILDQLVGSKIAVLNAELRFPLFRSLAFGFVPVGLPPVEGAVFYDVGVAWDEGSTVVLRRRASDNPTVVRTPLRSWGGSIRANLLGVVILRLDYTKPLDRPHDRSYWTVSLGPTF